MRLIKERWKWLLGFALFGLVGGWLVGLQSLGGMTPEQLEAAVGQVGSVERLLLVGAVQVAVIYGIGLGAAGLWLSEKSGLWKPFRLEKQSLKAALLAALFGGLVMILSDKLIFARFIPYVESVYTVKPSPLYLLMCITYGGVIEEVMLRLFVMSLLAWILGKLFARKSETVPVWIYVAANFISALLFAAGHLPATAAAMELTGLVLFRCFLLNGGLGLLFGWLYRKYGLGYSMLAHAGCHVVNQTVWFLFV